ncbi:MAG TPA: hypothetical protein VM582_07090 [Candidatus Thermoplasmatota archaeon]|nr:hypothetical protein [Candidatus Thermoplasmatota archaeon]
MRAAPLLLLVILTPLPTAAADDLPVAVGEIVVDLRWTTACPGPWGHEERDRVGPVTVRRYECDDPNV